MKPRQMSNKSFHSGFKHCRKKEKLRIYNTLTTMNIFPPCLAFEVEFEDFERRLDLYNQSRRTVLNIPRANFESQMD